MFKRYKVCSYEMELLFRDGEFQGLVEAGTRWFFDPLGKVRVDVVSQRDPWLVHEKLDLIVKSSALAERAVVLDLKDHERALVWIENRFSHLLPAGLYACWTGQSETPSRTAGTAQRSQPSGNGSPIVEAITTDRLCLVEIDLRETMVNVGYNDKCSARGQAG